jgi:hypothetical protein
MERNNLLVLTSVMSGLGSRAMPSLLDFFDANFDGVVSEVSRARDRYHLDGGLLRLLRLVKVFVIGLVPQVVKWILREQELCQH